MSKQLRIIVDKKGGITIDAEGFTGGSCLEATRFLEKQLGTVKKRDMKLGVPQKTIEYAINKTSG